jgi:phage FluMu protein Com
MKKQYGEFECTICGKVFFEKKKLDGHMGGAHKRDSTKDVKIPKCKFCGDLLIEGGNWAKWAIKQRNLICVKCKRVQNRASYRNRLESKAAKRQEVIDQAKEKITYAS